MAMTSDIVVGQGAGWGAVVSGVKFIAVQLKSSGRVSLFLQADGDPDPASDQEGIVLARGIQGTESAFSAGGLPVGTTLWLKSETDDEDVTLIAY